MRGCRLRTHSRTISFGGTASDSEPGSLRCDKASTNVSLSARM